MRTKLLAALSFGVACLTTPALAATTVVAVFGNDNPFLAGAAAGTFCCGGDSAPAQSPAVFSGFASGSILSFAPTGFTNGAGHGNVGPEGAANFDMLNYSTGIAPARGVGVNSLVGVFLSDAAPTPGAQPASLDFNGNRSFASLAPGLAQIFFIGDGLTGVGSGATQLFTAPTGATRLFLGVTDGSGWFNNGGTLDVAVTFEPARVAGVPEPATWAMMIIGLGSAGAVIRRRRRVAGLAC